MTMIRKQIYLEKDEDEYLKRRARELGITEAAVIRDLLKSESHRSTSGLNEAADRLNALMLRRRAEIPNGGSTEKFDREASYER